MRPPTAWPGARLGRPSIGGIRRGVKSPAGCAGLDGAGRSEVRDCMPSPRLFGARTRAQRLAGLGVGGALVVAAVALGAHASAMDDDRAMALSALRDVEARPEAKELAKEPLARAHEALDRAQRLRDVRDEPRARLCDGLARTWAETARDVVKAAEAETRARASRGSALDAGAQVERERATLEEGIGQTGRLKAQLEALESEGKQRPDRTSAVARDADGGAPRSLTPKAAPSGPAAPTPAPKTTPKGPKK